MKFELIETEEERKRREQEEALYESVHSIFGFRGVGTSFVEDAFGGHLYCVYVYDKEQKDAWVDYDVRRQFADHESLVNELLPQIKERRSSSVLEKLGQAMDDLYVEDLAPLFEATGKRWRVKWRRRANSPEESATFGKKELIDGAVKHTPLKQPKRGRPRGYKKVVDPKETQKLVSDIKAKARSLRKALGPDVRIPKTKLAKALGYGSPQKFSYALGRHSLSLDEVIKGI